MKFDNKDINYWIVSDTHINHKNIIKSISNWDDKTGCRDFKGRDDHNWEIINNINKCVMPDDILFHLGDWSFGGISSIWWFRKNINCKNIYLCIGNHDHHIKANKELPNCCKTQGGGILDGHYKDKIEAGILSAEPCKAQELFTDVQPMYEIQIHGHRITLSHYSMRTWFFHNKGSWMLFGHSHGSLQPEGKTIDVGIDNLHDNVLGEYRPIKFQEIQKIMSKKEVHKPDHHNKKTNP